MAIKDYDGDNFSCTQMQIELWQPSRRSKKKTIGLTMEESLSSTTMRRCLHHCSSPMDLPYVPRKCAQLRRDHQGRAQLPDPHPASEETQLYHRTQLRRDLLEDSARHRCRRHSILTVGFMDVKFRIKSSIKKRAAKNNSVSPQSQVE